MNKYLKRPKTQAGLILIVVLLIVPIMFLLSYTSISKLTFGERITTNVAERNHAFNAAETAIAEAEGWMQSGLEPFVHNFNPAVFSVSGSDSNGLFSDINMTMDQAIDDGRVISLGDIYVQGWNAGSGNVDYDGYLSSRNVNPVSGVPLSNPPVFMIQSSGFTQCIPPQEKNTAIFRITARGWGVANTSRVTLATYVSLTFNCGQPPSQGQG